jgi:glutathione S-transferase
MDRAFPRKEEAPVASIGHGNFETVMDVLASAVGKSRYLMGETFTAADVVIGSGVRWGLAFKLIPERKEFVDYVARLGERPALQRAEARDRQLAAA